MLLILKLALFWEGALAPPQTPTPYPSPPPLRREGGSIRSPTPHPKMQSVRSIKHLLSQLEKNRMFEFKILEQYHYFDDQTSYVLNEEKQQEYIPNVLEVKF